ncbi:C40 family peptidase, partial [Micrococcus sp. HMSC067E09]|uniref:C40 family peptidase n=3 Tax=Micrococcus TaxID=1269 RepID=UPI000AE70346
EAAERAEAERQAREAREQQPDPTPATDPAPSSGKNLSGAVEAAYSGIGGRYVYGGKVPGGWDCSGFAAWAYAQAGMSIPSQTSAIRASANTAPTSNPQPGDLVFQRGGGHVGIYVGDGMMISALNPSRGTLLHPVSWMPVSGYYTYVGP